MLLRVGSGSKLNIIGIMIIKIKKFLVLFIIDRKKLKVKENWTNLHKTDKFDFVSFGVNLTQMIVWIDTRKFYSKYLLKHFINTG